MAAKTLKLFAILACFAVVAWSTLSSDGLQSRALAEDETPAQQIQANITAMLQNKAAIAVLPDIPGGAAAATLDDAAWYAWQEFIALSWANVGVTGAANTASDAGARGVADKTKTFGQPASPGMASGKQVSYPALVWEANRHRAEIFTMGSGKAPNGYTSASSSSWGYNALPGYNYQTAYTITPSSSVINPALTPFVNLDEASQIGVCKMYGGMPYSKSAPGSFLLFLAKANYQEYGYIASRKWYDKTDILKTKVAGATLQNTSAYIVQNNKFPDPGALDGSSNAGKYVSFPNGTLEFKTAFRVATADEQSAYTSGKPIPGGYHIAPIRYYEAVEGKTGTFEYVDTYGALLSLHIIHKTPSAPYFIFATFEHTDNVIGTDGKPVEDANGTLNANAFTTTKPAPPPAGYVYPSSGTAPAGKYLVDATTPNVFQKPADSGTAVQQFIPTPSVDSTTLSTIQSAYQNTRDGATSTLASANSPDASKSYFSVNRRRFSIPSTIISVNQAAHSLISKYGYQSTGNTWLNYKLVNVQWVPAGTLTQKTPGLLYGDTSKGAKPSIPVESFYLSNSLVETNMILSTFSGQFGPFVQDKYDGISITDYYYNQTTYQDYNTTKPAVVKNVGDPFFNVYNGAGNNMGGCMGCHGNAAVAGADSSFILKSSSPFSIEEADSIDAPAMAAKHASFFAK